jgi:hypothetical protein
MKFWLSILAVIAVNAPVLARADGAAARETMRKALSHSLLGFDSAKLEVSLLIRSSAKDKGEDRRIVVQTLKQGSALHRRLCFLAPADLKNTAFLALGGDKPRQYLWLPGLGRLRQVSRSSRSESFLGTTFSFRDVEGWNLDDATYKSRGTEKIGGQDTEVIEATMKANDDYGTIVAWIRKSDYIPLRLKFHDRKGKHVKSLFTRQIDKTKKGIPYARAVRMENVVTGASTLLEIVQADFNATLSPSTFTTEHMRRGPDCVP